MEITPATVAEKRNVELDNVELLNVEIPQNLKKNTSVLETVMNVTTKKGNKMSRDKQIEEMAKDICHLPRTCDECEVGEIDRYICQAKKYAERAYNAGYRKASDVAREIGAILSGYNAGNYAEVTLLNKLYELKKKYESEEIINANHQ